MSFPLHYLCHLQYTSTFSLSADPKSPLKPTIKPFAMALASLRRIGAPISLLSKHQIFRPTSSASASASAKVSDRIVRLFAIDLDGNKREVVGLTGQTLLRALANAGLIDPASHRLEEIDACSAECEVHIAQEWLEKMPEPSYEERYVLTRASRNRVLNKHARLGCQVVLEPEHQNMVVAIPEPKPWDIP
ncbi:Ferredoxin [Rhynchospora pubera]|nr:Ferredoxin [Rhynchospora pubera]